MRMLKALSTLVLAGSLAASAASIVDRRGAIKTSGAKIVDKNGKQIQLTGMSLYWSVWGGEAYYKQSTVDWLVRDWKINVIRAAIAAEANGGFLYPATQRNQLRNVASVVDAAVNNGIYVIIDYHSHMAAENTDSAVKFFELMAQKYGDVPNVIFEIWNEPDTSAKGAKYEWPEVKTYAETVIPVIRKYSNNLVIVGTPSWSGKLKDPASDPLDPVKFPNVAYAFHFYACGHAINTLQASYISSIPVFISEWGTTGTDGGSNGLTCLNAAEKAAYKDPNRPSDKAQASAADWFTIKIDPAKISSCNWSVNNLTEASAALAGASGPEGGWDLEAGLSKSGKWVRNMIREHCAADSTTCPWLGDTLVPKTHEIPGRIAAVEYLSQGGTVKETDPAGGQLLNNVGDGDNLRFRVHVTSADSMVFRLRLQSWGEATVNVLVDGSQADSIKVRATGDRWAWFQGWTFTRLDTGVHEVTLQVAANQRNAFKMSALEIKKQGIQIHDLPSSLDLSRFRKLVNVGLGSDNDSSPMFLQNFRAGSQAMYAINVANTDSMEIQVLAVNLSGKPASLVLRTTKNLFQTRNLDTMEIPVDGKAALLTFKYAFVSAGLQYIQLDGLGITDPGVYVMGMGVGKAVGIRKTGFRAGLAPSLRRIGSRLELDLTGSTGSTKVQVVGADGRQILTQDVEAGQLVGLDLPRTLRPQWVRVGGAANTVLPVPPGF